MKLRPDKIEVLLVGSKFTLACSTMRSLVTLLLKAHIRSLGGLPGLDSSLGCPGGTGGQEYLTSVLVGRLAVSISGRERSCHNYPGTSHIHTFCLL